jgi:DNA (cytosine-5)-methyltransferase 1
MEQAGQKIKIATVCSGIGSPEQALKELKISHEIAFACEIDKYARQTYLANFTPNEMYTDLTAEEWDKSEQYSDLFIGGIPCQAFSLAGKRLGELDKRGLLFYDFYRYVKNQQPKVFIIENVKGLLSDNNGITFQNWCALLGRSMNTHVNMFNHDDSLLYNLHFKVLNSKDFGVPQNRERVFLIGIRNDLPNTFRFPIGERLKIRLKDILESEVDEKYYLSEKMLDYLHNTNEKHKFLGNGFEFKPRDENGIASCITARCFKQGCDDNYIQEPYCVAMRGRNPDNPSDRTTGANTEQRLEPNSQGITNTITSVQKDNLIVVKEATKQGYAIAKEGDSINLSNLNSETRRGRVGNQIANTLDTACYQGVVVTEPTLLLEHTLTGGKWDKMNESIRRVYNSNGLCPTVTASQGGHHEPKTMVNQRIRRLTPLECMRLQGFSDDYIKPCSDSQTYKQAGNSITVNVMKAIIKNLITIL